MSVVRDINVRGGECGGLKRREEKEDTGWEAYQREEEK